jgi:protein subunit release factor A
MDLNELRRLQQLMKSIRQLQELRKTLEKIRDLKTQQQIIRQFIEEKKDSFWRSSSKEDLEMMREKAGYDQETWQRIVRELLGEPPPKD